MFWESGVVGQVLYLEAEAAGARATGIGCFYDDPVHDVLGLKGHEFQSLYHFTVGIPVEDATADDADPATPGNRLSTLALPGTKQLPTEDLRLKLSAVDHCCAILTRNPSRKRPLAGEREHWPGRPVQFIHVRRRTDCAISRARPV